MKLPGANILPPVPDGGMPYQEWANQLPEYLRNSMKKSLARFGIGEALIRNYDDWERNRLTDVKT